MTGNYGWNIEAVKGFINNENEGDAPLVDEENSPPSIPMPTYGHYWCQSEGTVPSGAVKAGVDKDGGSVYVGRAFHQGEVLPAKVIPNQNIAFVAWDGLEHPKEEFEVLCKGGCTVIWQEQSGGAVPPGAVAVGSTADNERLYIGRVFHDGTLTPGKVHPSHGCCYIPYDGQELSFPTYEVLILR